MNSNELILSNKKQELTNVIDEIKKRKTGRKIDQYFKDPSDGYNKHREFFAAGKTHKQRLLIAANRTGKSQSAGCELVYHLTTDYPAWWTGHRFSGPTHWWVIGDTKETTRDVLQNLLLGPVGEFGSGLIPRKAIDFDSLTDAKKADTTLNMVRVRTKQGPYSTVTFKSSEQGRKAFQGTEVSIWLDEECPYEVYEECLTRIATGNNILMMTFTPLQGMTGVVKSFMRDGDVMSEGETGNSKYVQRMTWDDAPHLTTEIKEMLIASYAPFQRDARTKGIPALGAGVIFPISEALYIIEPIEIPAHWPKAYGLDVGRSTAAVWIAMDRDTQTLYAYSEYFNAGEDTVPSTHAQSIIARGKWIKGAIDTAARGRSATDGQRLSEMYYDLGLNIQNADKAVEAGLLEMLELFSQGRLKIFSTCKQLIAEIRGYHRNEKGQIVKTNDHLCVAEGTLITTARGDIPIEKVTTNDYALTRKGFKRVLFSGQTGENRLTYNVNGLIITGEHPVFVNDEFISVEELFKCQNNIVKNLMDLNSTVDSICQEGITSEHLTSRLKKNTEQDYCTGVSGFPTLDKSQKDCKSIISIETNPTTISRTLNLLRISKTNNTSSKTDQTLKSVKRNNNLTQLDHSHLLGTGVQKEGSGIQNTGSDVILKKNTLAGYVANSTSQEGLEENQAFVTPQSVSGKSINLKVEGIEVLNEELTKIYLNGVTSKVYDLTIEDQHEYFANGILISNCDSLRYAIFTRDRILHTKAELETPVYTELDYTFESSSDDAWMGI